MMTQLFWPTTIDHNERLLSDHDSTIYRRHLNELQLSRKCPQVHEKLMANFPENMITNPGSW